MRCRESDAELLADGKREWAFEKARLRPHVLPDGRAFHVSIEEASGVGLAGMFANTSGLFGDLLTFGKATGQLDPDAGACVITVRVDGEITHLRQYETRAQAVEAGLALQASLQASGLETLDD